MIPRTTLSFLLSPFSSSSFCRPLLTAITVAALIATAGCTKEDPEAKFLSLMSKAEQFQKDEKWDEARITLSSAIDLKPTPEAFYQLADVMLRLKAFGKAREFYQSTINLDPNHRQARLHLAAFLLAAKQYEESEGHIRKLLELYPDDAEVNVLHASWLSSRKKFPDARTTLNRVLARDEKDFGATAALAEVTLAEGNPAEAEKLFEKARLLKPDNQPVRLALADLMMQQGRLEEAEGMLENLVKSDPENANLRYFLGEFLLLRGSNERAVEQYQEMIKSDPRRHDARDRMYDFLVLKRDFTAAKKLSQELENTDKSDAGVSYFQGRDAELDGRLEDALKLFLKSMEVMPGFGPGFRRGGMIEMQLGRGNEAVEHLNQAITINPNDVAARLALAKHYFMSKDFGQSKEQLARIFQVFPRQVGANILRADIALVEGDLAGAERVYKGLVESLPNNPSGYFKMAILKEQQKDLPAAIENYRKTAFFDREVLIPAGRLAELVVQRDGIDAAITEITSMRERSTRQKAEYSVILASLILRKGGDDKSAVIAEARKFADEAIKLNGNLLQGYYLLAQLDGLSGDSEGVLANYKLLSEKNPENTPGRMIYAVTLERLGKNVEAAEQYREILKRDTRFAPAANNLAWLLATQLSGDLDEALRLAQTAKETLPNLSAITDTLGWVYFKRGQGKAAQPYLEEAIEQELKVNPSRPDGKRSVNPEILYHLAEVKFVNGDTAGAAAALKEAIDLGIKNSKALSDAVVNLEQRLSK